MSDDAPDDRRGCANLGTALLCALGIATAVAMLAPYAEDWFLGPETPPAASHGLESLCLTPLTLPLGVSLLVAASPRRLASPLLRLAALVVGVANLLIVGFVALPVAWSLGMVLLPVAVVVVLILRSERERRHAEEPSPSVSGEDEP